MRVQLRAAIIGAAALVGFAGVACAQGSITQDPGKITPGNLSSQRLGPSAGSPAAGVSGGLGASDLPSGNWPATTYGSGAPIFHGTPGATGVGGRTDATPDYDNSAGGNIGSRPGPDRGATRRGSGGAGGATAIGGGR